MHPSNDWLLRSAGSKTADQCGEPGAAVRCRGLDYFIFFAITVLTILWRTMTNHTGSGKPGRAGFDGWGWRDREGAGRIAGPGATSARPPPRSRTRGRTPPVSERVQDLLAIPGQLGLADAA